MANMSYCRFQNTNADMLDCIEELDTIEDCKAYLENEISSDAERRALRKFFVLCERVIEDYSWILEEINEKI